MIRETAIKIRNSYMNKESLDNDEYNKFKDRYPTFFNMLITPDMDIDMFNKLFETIEKLNNNEVDSFNAAGEFSQFGATKYLYNKFGTPSQSQLKNASNKLQKQFNNQ